MAQLYTRATIVQPHTVAALLCYPTTPIQEEEAQTTASRRNWYSLPPPTMDPPLAVHSAYPKYENPLLRYRYARLPSFSVALMPGRQVHYHTAILTQE
jgi:hypothetical protein